MSLPRVHRPLVVVFLLVALLTTATAFDEPALSKEQVRHFLATAKVVRAAPAQKGITGTWRLTLTDGALTHDAHFQSVDEYKSKMEFSNGRMELNFVDSYKYNIAAYRLAEMLGLDNMVPVYVERKWRGNTGSFGWWLPAKMDEEQRKKHGVQPPDSEAWNRQMYKIRIFDQLIFDSDPNLTNILIGENWQLWRIDFTRAFRMYKDPPALRDLDRCDRQLFEKLKALDGAQVVANTRGYLDKDRIKAMMVRRDKIVQHLQRVIAEKGEAEVLY